MKFCKVLTGVRCCLLAAVLMLPSIGLASSMPIGVGVHVIGASNDDQIRQLELAAHAHLNSIRADVAWKYTEQVRGELSVPPAWDRFVDAALKRGMKLDLILDYGNPLYDGGDKPRSKEAIDGFIRYALFIVQHYRGKVDTYEIWNEWDTRTGGFPPGSPDDYAALFKRVFPALKANAPEVRFLVSSGTSPGWYDRLAQLGVIAQGDGVAIHPYNYQEGGELGPERVATSIRALQKQLTKMTGKSALDFYITEIGWPTNTGRFGMSEQVVGDFVPRLALLMTAMPYVKGVWWYDLVDDGSDPLDKEARFGLVRQDHSPKPAYLSMASIIDFVRNREMTFNEKSELERGFVVLDMSAGIGRGVEFVAWDAGAGHASLGLECDRSSGPYTSGRSQSGLRLSPQPQIVWVRGRDCDERPVGGVRGD